MALEWTDSLSVNIVEIDKQHQKLIIMINELDQAMKQGKGKDVLGKIINGLVSYVSVHFKTEEQYFDRFQYPDSDTHKSEHLDFVKKVSQFKDRFETNQLGISIDIMNFLSSWLQHHIKGSDKKYTPFFHEKGLK